MYIIYILYIYVYTYMYIMSQYFPKPYERSVENVKVELYLSSYATTEDLNRATGVDTSNLAAKSDLACFKSESDKVDTDKLKTVSTDLLGYII